MRRALVIGLGTGSTAGWLGAVPAIDRVDVVELEPLILDVARACAAVNHDVMNNPKMHITIGDAREMLLTTRERYELMMSEPSNPYRAGITSLFTQEYYRAAADRLADDGVFVQWIQAYEIDTPTLRTVYATLASVFSQVETWHTNPGDLVLVASKQRRTHRVSDLSRQIAEEPYKSALNFAWRAIDVHGLLAHYIANDDVARRIARSPGVDLNTDDRNVVELRLARSVGVTLTTVADIRNAALAAAASRPPLDDGEAVQWPAVDTAWLSYTAGMGSFLDTRTVGPPADQARQAALIQYYRNEDLPGARRLWEQQSEGARDPTEMVMLADVTAETGFEQATAFIDRLRVHRPGEADVMLATLRLRQSKVGDAAAAIESALTRFWTDPWDHVSVHGPCGPARADYWHQLAFARPAYVRRARAAVRRACQRGSAAPDQSGIDATGRFPRAVPSRGRCAGTAHALDGNVSASAPRLLSGVGPSARCGSRP